MNDLIIVGAGLGGLLTARLALQQGKTVTVLERSDVSGGLARSPLLGGVPVNLGPHALYLGGPAEKALARLHLDTAGFVPKPQTCGAFETSLLSYGSGASGLMTASWLSWGERRQLLSALPAVAFPPQLSAQAWLDTFESPRVRGVLGSLLRVTTYCAMLDLLPASVALAQLRAGLRGVRYLEAGWQGLVDQLASGVPVRHARVVSATPDGTVVLESGERLQGKTVVLAVPLSVAAKLTEAPSVLARHATAHPVRAACLDVVVSSLPAPERRLVLGMDRPLYFSVHTAPGTTGPIRLHIARYLDARAPMDSAEVQRELEAFLELAQPGWERVCVAKRFFPHLTVMEDVPTGEALALEGQLRWVSGVATGGFLFDAVAQAAMETLEALEHHE